MAALVENDTEIYRDMSNAVILDISKAVTAMEFPVQASLMLGGEV